MSQKKEDKINTLGVLLKHNDLKALNSSNKEVGVAIWTASGECLFLSDAIRHLYSYHGPSEYFTLDRYLGESSAQKLVPTGESTYIKTLYLSQVSDKKNTGSIEAFLKRVELHPKGYGILGFVKRIGISYAPSLHQDLFKDFCLTKQQYSILSLVLEGLSNKEIAQHLNLSEQGVKYHVGHLFKKFKTQNRIELRRKVNQFEKNLDSTTATARGHK